MLGPLEPTSGISKQLRFGIIFPIGFLDVLIFLLFDSHVNTIRKIKQSHINNIPVQLTYLEATIHASRRLPTLLRFVYLILSLLLSFPCNPVKYNF